MLELGAPAPRLPSAWRRAGASPRHQAPPSGAHVPPRPFHHGSHRGHTLAAQPQRGPGPSASSFSPDETGRRWPGFPGPGAGPRSGALGGCLRVAEQRREPTVARCRRVRPSAAFLSSCFSGSETRGPPATAPPQERGPAGRRPHTPGPRAPVTRPKRPHLLAQPLPVLPRPNAPSGHCPSGECVKILLLPPSRRRVLCTFKRSGRFCGGQASPPAAPPEGDPLSM